MSPKSLALALGLLALLGCAAPVRREIDALLCDRTAHPADLLPPAASKPAEPELPPPRPLDKGVPNLEQRLTVPPHVPGAQTPPIKMPPESAPQKERDEARKKYFPPLPALGPEPAPVPGPQGRPLALADLQALARANNPMLRQAAADIEAAKGASLQAGLYPNPTVGTTGQTAGPGGGPFYGVTASQMIKTMGKLNLSKAAAEMDVINAQLAFRKAENDVMTQVRTGYFSVIVAQESMRANGALVQLTDELYRVMVSQQRGGEAAAYEAMQIGVWAAQARAGLLTARNAYQLAWRQLASALGIPKMTPTEVEGRADMPIPRFDFQKSLAHVLANHTDVQATRYGIDKARYNLRLATVTAYPDVNVFATIQQDATPVFPAGPNRIISTIQMSVPVPLFDRNQGGIQQAQGQLVRALEEPHRVKTDLQARFSEAFRRYDENRSLLELYRTDILPKQIQAFRSAVKRHYGGGAVGDPGVLGRPQDVPFTDLVQSEQNLVTQVGLYLNILGAEWLAVVDVASYLQTDDLFQLADGHFPADVPDLDQVLQFPCCHPCSPIPPALLAPVSVNWLPSAETLGQVPAPVPAEQHGTLSLPLQPAGATAPGRAMVRFAPPVADSR